MSSILSDMFFGRVDKHLKNIISELYRKLFRVEF